jgi:two-component system cell cycle response regulator DivK
MWNIMYSVLVVDDNEWSRDLLARRLLRRGYHVILAPDGREGIALAHDRLPDLILMDLSLPEIDGWEATRHLKAHPATRLIPILAVTAHAMPADRQKAMEAGCDGYHTKPVDFESLLRSMKTLLDARIHTRLPAATVAAALPVTPAAVRGNPQC